MYSRGITPPAIAVDELECPLPRSNGSKSSTTWPYCPCPPVCRTNLSIGAVGASQSLPVGNSRPAHLGLDAELPPHPVHKYFQMQFSHARHNGLTRFLVEAHHERRVFVGELAEGVGLRRSWSARVIGSMATDTTGLGNLGGSRTTWSTIGADGVPCEGVFQTDGGADIARRNVLQFLAVVGVHQEQAPHALPPLAGDVLD